MHDIPVTNKVIKVSKIAALQICLFMAGNILQEDR